MSLPAGLFGPVGWAVVLAVLSTACYASSAVMQEREATPPGSGTSASLQPLIRRPRWWLAVGGTVTGAGLHIAALAWGPLSLIQPIGVLTLVLALPLGARLSGRIVSRREWTAAAAVAGGLAAILGVAPHGAPLPHLSSAGILGTAAVVGAVAAGLSALAMRLAGHRIAPVIRAAAAATLFGTASGMARVAVTGGPVILAASVAVVGSVVGLGLAQLAYRGGGFAAPLATLNLVDPMAAVVIGVALLGEPFPVTPTRIAFGALGLAVTAAGIGALTRRHPPEPRSPDRTPEIGAAAPVAEESEVAHVVR